MIYAICDYNAGIWHLVGDYATESDIMSFWNLFCNSDIYRYRSLGLYLVGDFDTVTGRITSRYPQCVVRYIPDVQPQWGGSCGGNSPLKSCLATKREDKKRWFCRYLDVVFSKFATLKSLKKKDN